MKNWSSYPRIARQKPRFALLIGLLFLLLAIGSYPVIRARADAGPFPTRTPTITLTPQPSPTPTELLITLTPTITLVPTPTELVLEQELPPPVIVPTPTQPPDSGRSLFVCWPIALILIIAIIIASTYFLTRYSSQAQPIE
jgi:hypothetical protein